MKATFCQQQTTSLHLGLARSEIKPGITDVDTWNHTVHFQKQLIYAKLKDPDCARYFFHPRLQWGFLLRLYSNSITTL